MAFAFAVLSCSLQLGPLSRRPHPFDGAVSGVIQRVEIRDFLFSVLSTVNPINPIKLEKCWYSNDKLGIVMSSKSVLIVSTIDA